MAQENEKFIRRWFEEVWNQKREEGIDEMLDDESVHRGFGTTESIKIRARNNFREFYRAFVSTFPNIHITVEDTVCEGDKMSARCTVRATHTGEDLDVLPTDQPVEFTGLTFVKIKDGKIVEALNEFDFMKMYSQVGALTLNL